MQLDQGLAIDIANMTFILGLATGAGLGILAASLVAYLRGPRQVYVSADEQVVVDMHFDGLPALLIEPSDEVPS